MSSEVNTPADLRTSPNTSENTREDMDPEDLCMTQSSILYLLQEATKLVAPPKQHSLGTAKLHDGTKETIVSHDSTRFEQKVQEVGTPEKQTSFTGAFSMLSCSPWEVMSLINLQCERLLHSGGTHEVEEDSQRHKTKMDTEDGDVAQEFPSAVSTSPESLRADTMEHAMESDVCCSVPHIIDPTDNLSIRHTSENGEGATVEAVEGLAELISKTTEDGLLSSRVMSDSRTDHCYLVETSVLPLDLTKKVEICEHTIENCEGVNKMGSVSSISDAAQSPEISSVDFTSSLVAEKYQDPCFSFNECENAESECALMSETPPPPRTDLNNNLEDEALQEAEKTHTVVSAQARWGNQRRTPRKQAHPARSPDLNDPGLQGVTFSMHTELDHSTDQCRLLITSNYSKLCRRGRRSRSCRSRSLQSSQRTSSSEEESDSSSMCKKICASCCTRKTPLWRDAEDGTPLCNACGIRYKKYRVRCLQCWNIPRKEASSNSKCSKCGDLQVASQSK